MNRSLPSFHLFKQLPPEIRLLIWEAAARYEPAGLCIVRTKREYQIEIRFINGQVEREQPGFEEDDEEGDEDDDEDEEDDEDDDELPDFMSFIQPLLVQRERSPLFHLCRESRCVARKYIPHEENSIGACLSTFRRYKPEKDLLIISRGLLFVSPAHAWKLLSKVQHIGIAHYDDGLLVAINQLMTWNSSYFPKLRTITMINTSGIDLHLERAYRRCRLEDDDMSEYEARGGRQLINDYIHLLVHLPIVLDRKARVHFQKLENNGPGPDYDPTTMLSRSSVSFTQWP
ncbi:hypothetical protein F5Y04DRAFT_280692 [Hypomontagnella monticulosa]|nr:hypothetical protein F5Y04DRAFT_280692 [Hypomontagnella monticulosa]